MKWSFKKFTQALLHIFFRKIEIVGEENVPKEGPLLFIANHINGLVDGMLLVGCLPRYPLLLGKATLWDNPLLAFFINLSGGVPVYRAQDNPEQMSKNEDAFRNCYDVLKEGGVLGIFPEGISHNEPGIQPLKTGAARIILGAEKQYGDLGIHVVPVGFTFESKMHFRSRVLVNIGKPIDLSEYQQNTAEVDEREQVQQLTDYMGDAIKRQTLNYESWEEAGVIESAVDVYLHQQQSSAENEELTQTFSLRKSFVKAYRELQEQAPQKVQHVVKSMIAYRQSLQMFSLKQSQLTRHPTFLRLAYLYQLLMLMGIQFPLAFVGFALNAIPFLIIRNVGSLAREDVDLHATLKIIAGLVLFPLTWLIEAGVIATLTHYHWGLFILIFAPLSGAFAVSFMEHRDELISQARAYFLLSTFKKVHQELEQRYQQLNQDVSELITIYQDYLKKKRGD